MKINNNNELPIYDFKKEIGYPMRLINLEDFSVYNPNKIKCRIPLMMPLLPGGDPVKEKIKTSVTHIKNKERPSKEQFEATNYVEVNIPQEIAFGCPRDHGGIVKKGEQFICVFLNGEMGSIRVIGRDI